MFGVDNESNRHREKKRNDYLALRKCPSEIRRVLDESGSEA